MDIIRPFVSETALKGTLYMMKKTTLALAVLAAAFSLGACNNGTPANKPAASGAKAASGTASASAASGAASAPAGLETENKQLSYLVGYQFAMQMQLADLKKSGIELDYDVLREAMNDQIAGKDARLKPEQAQAVMQSVGKKIEETLAKEAEAAQAANQKFLDENKAKEGVQTTASGLQHKTNKDGSGAKIEAGDVAHVEYEGRLTNGTVFDSTKDNGGQPFAVPVVDGTVIPGWIEGLQLMKEGGEYTLYIPSNLAYGPQSPSPKIPANSVLVFDMKITKVEKGAAKKMMQPPQPTPKKK